MDKRAWVLILFLIVIFIGLITLNYYVNKPHENFAMVEVCSKGIATIIKRSMNLEDGDNSLPAELKTSKCIELYDFQKMTDSGMAFKSSVQSTLYNLFQSTDSDIPYIDKFFDWKVKDNTGALVPVNWAVSLDPPGSTDFQGTVNLLTTVIIPMVIRLRDIFKDIVSSTEMATKYNTAANSVNRAFINGFIAKYSGFDDGSADRLRTAGTEENVMFKSLTTKTTYRDPLATSFKLPRIVKDFAYDYIFKVDYNAAAQCNINIIDTQADNDIKLYVRLKQLFDLWRNMKKTGQVAFTAGDLNGSAFQNSAGDYSKAELIKYFIEELKNPKINKSLTDEEHTATIMNKMINDSFITDGSVNDGRLISDPQCKSDVGKLLCNIQITSDKICKPNMSACAGSDEFNKFCTAVNSIISSAADASAKMPTFDLTNLPTTPTTTPGATTTTSSATTTTRAVTTTTASSGGSGSGSGLGSGSGSGLGSGSGSGSGSGGIPGAPLSAGAGAPLLAGAGAPLLAGAGGVASASNQALQAKINQYSIPSYLDRSTQELLIFVYDKLAASYNFDDEDVPDDIKQAISQLPPSGKANICARYCQLTTRCNGICKLAGCMNCQVGTGAQAGSDAEGAPSSSLGYAGVDDDYGLLGFLDDISQSNLISGTGGMVASYGNGVQDQYKHMGPMISQKDTSGVSNIFAPYIIMAPKKDGSAYGAYLLDDPNDPQYRQYIDDLVKSY